MTCIWTVLKRNTLCQNLCYIHTLSKDSQRMFLFSKIFERALEIDGYRFWGVKKGHRRLLIVTPTSASSTYIYNHCGSRAFLGLHVNGLKKKLFFVCCLSLLMKNSFFGTYALDISSLTSSIKYISEKYQRLVIVCFFYHDIMCLKGQQEPIWMQSIQQSILDRMSEFEII